MILLSAHIDKVLDEVPSFSRGKFKGLLDNDVGKLVVYLALFGNDALLELEKKGELKVFHNTGEEYGILINPPRLQDQDIAVCVDVASGRYYDKADFVIENISHVKDKKIKKIKEGLLWEGFKVKMREYTGNPDEEDEAFAWRSLGIPCMSFIIPVAGDCWHCDCTVSAEKILRAVHGLRRTICFLR